MFKKAFILLVLLLFFSSSVFAVRLIDPLSKTLSLDETNFVGSVPVGNTIELIFSKELVDKYENLSLLTPLPTGFDYEIKVEMESIKMFISVPKNAPVGNYSFTVELFGLGKSDKVSLSFEVLKNSLDVSPVDISEAFVSVNSPASYTLFFVNRSDSDAIFFISTNLPSNWMNEDSLSKENYSKKVIVPRRGNLYESFLVFPRLQGEKEFAVSVSFEDVSKEFLFKVNAQPTLKSKLETIFYGLPFYSFSMLPSYFLNGLFSFCIN
jgi:hypothetical protein